MGANPGYDRKVTHHVDQISLRAIPLYEPAIVGRSTYFGRSPPLEPSLGTQHDTWAGHPRKLFDNSNIIHHRSFSRIIPHVCTCVIRKLVSNCYS